MFLFLTDFVELSGESLTNLKAVLKKAKADLTKRDTIREKAHDDMRKATSLSKQTILLTHQKRFEDAHKSLINAKELISNLQDLADEYPEIVFGGGMFSAALQEYSEANIFSRLVEENRYVSPEEINVPTVDFVLGLGDVVGELRRLSLDSLREGNVKKGEECLEIMDEIFIELMGLDEAYMLVPGLRHKSDTARRIIETTRGDITQEVRRKALEDYLRKFELQQLKPQQSEIKKVKPRKTKK